MNTIKQLIEKYCPEGVEYKPLWSLTIWDKRFNGVEKSHQEKIIKYFYYLAKDLQPLIVENGDVKILTTNVSNLFTTKELAGDNIANGEVVSIPWGGNLNIQYYKGDFITSDNRIATSINTNVLDNKFLYYWMINNKELIESFYRGAGIKHPDMNKVLNLIIPVPPIPVQHEIVRILDNFTSLEAELEAELEARRKQYEYYRDQLLSFKHLSGGGKSNVEWKTLPEIAINLDSKRRPIKSSNRIAGKYPYYGASGIVDYVNDYIFDGDYLLISEDGANLLARSSKIAFSIHGKNWVNNHAHVLSFDNSIRRRFAEYYIEHLDISKYVSAGAQPKLTKDKLNSIPIPQPSIEEQRRIVSILDRFESLVNGITTGLPAEIAARHQQYEYYRDQLLTFKRKS